MRRRRTARPSQGFGDGQSPSFGGLSNERTLPTPQNSIANRLQNAPRNPDAQRAVSGADAPEGVFRAFAEAVSNDAKPLAEQVQKLLDLIDAGKETEAASFAASLSANLASYLPEDPESATVLAEAMAERAWVGRAVPGEPKNAPLANSNPDQPRGQPDNAGQFVSTGGVSSSPSGTTEKTKVRSVKSSPKATGLNLTQRALPKRRNPT